MEVDERSLVAVVMIGFRMVGDSLIASVNVRIRPKNAISMCDMREWRG